MKREINIAEILRKKPKGTKLYSPICGECEFDMIDMENEEFGAPIIDVIDLVGTRHSFYENGLYYTEGECLLFPSKVLKDWSKFAWKKGDVLVTNDCKVECIFVEFTDKEYRTFRGKYTILTDDDGSIDYFGDKETLSTLKYNIEDKDAAQCYINTIEERLGGKLNMETLEIEPAKPKWTPKPFDKVLVRNNDSNSCWKPMLFSMMLKNGYAGIDGFIYPYCIPYNEETAKLIGTTNDYKED